MDSRRLLGTIIVIILFFFGIVFALASAYAPIRLAVPAILFITGFGVIATLHIVTRKPSEIIQKVACIHARKMNRRAILIITLIAGALIYTAVFVVAMSDYEAWRIAEMNANPYMDPHPFVGTLHGGLMTVIGLTMWCMVGVIYLAHNRGARMHASP